MKNPYLSLLKTSWKYAGNQKRRFVFIYILLITASVFLALHPVLYGWFIDKLQQDPGSIIQYTWIFAGSFLGLKLMEWAFHGPARVMERKLAFSIGHSYLGDLYHKVLHLPAGWHQENHSGSSINRLRKGHEALRNFYQTGFAYL
ncbi:MAG: ABC transporter transmembrane domain-containing protein, partial [Cytophagaceae bacterium]